MFEFLYKCVCFLLFIVFPIGTNSWTYDEQDKWGGFCRGKSQSPIAIYSKKTNCAKHFPELKFNYEGPWDMDPDKSTLSNNGHTFALKIKNEPPSIFGGGLDEQDYVFAELHFHWNAEHVLNDIRYPLEGHFVHYAREYGNFENAKKQRNGIAVIAVFFEYDSEDNPALDSILRKIPAIAHNLNDPVNLNAPIELQELIPSHNQRFYRYYGSLTTPDCDEVVVWTIMTEISTISKRQWKHLTNIYTEDDQRLVSNYRKLQPLNGRAICRNICN